MNSPEQIKDFLSENITAKKISCVDDVRKCIEDLNDIETRLYFTEKSRSGYTSYAPNTSNSVKDDILDLILTDIRNFSSYQIADFNPTGQLDDVVEKISVSQIHKFNDLIDNFKTAICSIEDVDPDKLTFYTLCLRSPTSQHVIYLFRRTTKFKKLHTNGFFGRFLNGAFTEFDSKLIGIDGLVDIIVIDDTAFIFNHIAPERIFKMNEQYNEIAVKALNKLREKNGIENFDEFEDDCLNDLRIQKTLAKLSSEPALLDNVFTDFNSIKKTIELFDLDLEISHYNNKEKIVYPGHDKQTLMEILRIIRDAYYVSTVNHRQGLDRMA